MICRLPVSEYALLIDFSDATQGFQAEIIYELRVFYNLRHATAEPLQRTQFLGRR